MKLLNTHFHGMMETISNFFLLNLLWILFSLPIITVFPATSAMFAILKDWKEDKHIPILSSFLSYFKKYFTQSFLTGLLFFGGFCLLYLDYLFIQELSTFMRIIVFSTILLISIVILFTGIYYFPVMVQHKLPFKKTIKLSFMYSIMYFPITILLVLLLISTALIVYLIPVLSIIAFSVAAYIIYILCHRCFLKAKSIVN